MLSIGDVWQGADLSRDLTNTAMPRTAVGCKTLTLTEGKRCDPRLFEWITHLTPGRARHHPFLALFAAQRDFPARDEPLPMPSDPNEGD